MKYKVHLIPTSTTVYFEMYPSDLIFKKEYSSIKDMILNETGEWLDKQTAITLLCCGTRTYIGDSNRYSHCNAPYGNIENISYPVDSRTMLARMKEMMKRRLINFRWDA